MGAMAISLEPSRGRASDPDMAPSSSLGWITMILYGGVGILDWHGPCGDTTLGHQLGHR